MSPENKSQCTDYHDTGNTDFVVLLLLLSYMVVVKLGLRGEWSCEIMC